MTPGGKFVVPRTILHSELWETKPAWWFKVWFYILANANFKDHNEKLLRGDLFTSYDTIYRDCKLNKEGVTAEAIDNVLRFYRKTGLITSRKTTRGVIISVRNYDKLQRFEAFTNDTENDASNDYGTAQERHYKETNVTNVTNNNYLPKSKTGKEQTLGEKPNLGTDTQPYKGKVVGVTPKLGSASQPKQKDPRIIFLTNLKRARSEFDKLLSVLSPERLEEYGYSLNTTACVKGIQYYLERYKAVCGKEHFPCKITQITRCLKNFNAIIFDLEGLNLPPSKIDEVIGRAIDRWFSTTSPEPSNLNLNHFCGENKEGEPSLIIDNSVREVLYELGIIRDAPSVAHFEDVV